MSVLLCSIAAAVVVLQGELKPLKEERQLADAQQIALEYSRLEAPEVGTIGWTKTTVQRADLDGATHYVVQRVGEIADFASPGIRTLESRGIFDGELRLVRELRLEQPLGSEAKPMELEWGKDGFRWRMGRGRWTAAEDATRPTAETDIALFVHGLSISTPWQAQVFDSVTKEVQTLTIGAGKDSESDGVATKVFAVEGASPTSHVLLSDGTYLRSQMGDLGIIGVNVVDTVERALRRMVADNAALEAVLNDKLPSAWSEKKGTFTNPVLGSSLKLPKGWRRAPDREVEGTHFHAFSGDSNAYVSLAVTVLGTGYTLEGWREGLLETYTEVAVDGAVKVKKTSFAKQDALSFEFVRAGEATLDSKAVAWEHDGLGFLLIGGTWSGGSKKLRKETDGVMKSFRVSR